MIRERRRQYSRLEIALDAAQVANRLPRPLNTPQSPTEQTANQIAYVTNAEHLICRRLLEHLAANYPDDACHIDTGRPLQWATAQRQWLVAVDACHWPVFSVAAVIGIIQNQQVTLSVIADPLNDRIFVAERGRGAYQHFVHGQVQLLRVSRFTHIKYARLGVGWGHRTTTQQRGHGLLRMALPQLRIQAINAGPLGMTQVAAGRLEVYLHATQRPWTALTSALLVTEAAGQLTGLDGQPWTVDQPAMLAGNGLQADIHRQVASTPFPEL